MTKLTPNQESDLVAFENAYQRMLREQELIEHEVRQQVAGRLETHRRKAVMLGRVAVGNGVPVLRLGAKDRRGLKTKNWATIRQFLDSYDDGSTVTPKFVLEGDLLTITLSGNELRAAQQREEWPADVAGYESAQFRVMPNGMYAPLEPELFVHEVGRNHPVKSAYALARDKGVAEVRAFLESEGWFDNANN